MSKSNTTTEKNGPNTPAFEFKINVEPIDDPICGILRQEMRNELTPHYADFKGPLPGSGHPARPKNLPENTVFLVARSHTAEGLSVISSADADTDGVMGCVAIYPLPADKAPYAELYGELFSGDVKTAGVIAEIKRMFVRAAYRRTGVATALLEASERIARERFEARWVVLETLPKMTGARRFYEQNGYVARGHFGHYDVRDSVFYPKTLSR